MKDNPANTISKEKAASAHWGFLADGAQQANIPALKEAVNDLLEYLRETGMCEACFNWEYDKLILNVAVEAAAYVLSKEGIACT